MDLDTISAELVNLRPKTRVFSMGVIIDALPFLSVFDCNRLGLFRPGIRANVAAKWARGDQAAPFLSAVIAADAPGVRISYTYEGRAYEQRAGVCYRRAGFGRVPLFVCPETGRPCQNLYFVGGRFVSRYAFRGLYSLQNVTPGRRLAVRYGRAENRITALIDERGRRRLKYAGKPTKYARRIEAAENKARGLRTSYALFSGDVGQLFRAF